MVDEITTSELNDLATGPERITGDEGTVKERPLQETIDGDRYIASKGITGPPYGLRIAKIRFPGSV